MTLPERGFVRIREDDSVPPLLKGQYAMVQDTHQNATTGQWESDLEVHTWDGEGTTTLPSESLDFLPPDVLARLVFLRESWGAAETTRVAGGAVDGRLDEAIERYVQAWDAFREALPHKKRALGSTNLDWLARDQWQAAQSLGFGLKDIPSAMSLGEAWVRLVGTTETVAYETWRALGDSAHILI